MQSEAVSYAYRVWRREWRGKGKEYVRPPDFQFPFYGNTQIFHSFRLEASLSGNSTTAGLLLRGPLSIIS